MTLLSLTQFWEVLRAEWAGWRLRLRFIYISNGSGWKWLPRFQISSRAISVSRISSWLCLFVASFTTWDEIWVASFPFSTDRQLKFRLNHRHFLYYCYLFIFFCLLIISRTVSYFVVVDYVIQQSNWLIKCWGLRGSNLLEWAVSSWAFRGFIGIFGFELCHYWFS